MEVFCMLSFFAAYIPQKVARTFVKFIHLSTLPRVYLPPTMAASRFLRGTGGHEIWWGSGARLVVRCSSVVEAFACVLCLRTWMWPWRYHPYRIPMGKNKNIIFLLFFSLFYYWMRTPGFWTGVISVFGKQRWDIYIYKSIYIHIYIYTLYRYLKIHVYTHICTLFTKINIPWSMVSFFLPLELGLVSQAPRDNPVVRMASHSHGPVHSPYILTTLPFLGAWWSPLLDQTWSFIYS